MYWLECGVHIKFIVTIHFNQVIAILECDCFMSDKYARVGLFIFNVQKNLTSIIWKQKIQSTYEAWSYELRMPW